MSRGTGHGLQCNVGTLCSRRFSKTNFISTEKTSLDRLAVPGLWSVVWHPCSAPHHEELSLCFPSCEEDHFLIPNTTFLNAHNITIQTTHSNPIRHFLTFRCISRPVITIRNQHLTSTFKVISRCESMAFSNKRAWFGQWQKWLHGKISDDRISKVSHQSR